jgi:hypothetical protein
MSLNKETNNDQTTEQSSRASLVFAKSHNKWTQTFIREH